MMQSGVYTSNMFLSAEATSSNLFSGSIPAFLVRRCLSITRICSHRIIEFSERLLSTGEIKTWLGRIFFRIFVVKGTTMVWGLYGLARSVCTTKTGRNPVCSVPFVGVRSAHQISPLFTSIEFHHWPIFLRKTSVALNTLLLRKDFSSPSENHPQVLSPLHLLGGQRKHFSRGFRSSHQDIKFLAMFYTLFITSTLNINVDGEVSQVKMGGEKCGLSYCMSRGVKKTMARC